MLKVGKDTNSIKKQKLSRTEAQKYLEKYTQRISDEKKIESDKEYSNLQLTWNNDIINKSVPWIPTKTERLLGIGSFQGALEIAMSHFFEKVVCVDHESYLPKWKPDNVFFHKANIDSNEWKMPEENTPFDVTYMIETIEHLLWSPVPLLKWVRNNSHLFVLSTPDDQEWPAMEIKPWTRHQHFKNIPPAFPGAQGNPEPMYHCKQYNQAEFMELLDFAGFRVLEFFRTGAGGHQMVAIAQPRF